MKTLICSAVCATLLFSAASLAETNASTVMVGGASMYPSRNIVENALNSKDHTTLVAAVKAAGLADTLQGAGPFTVFAPTNAAFSKLPAGTVDNLLKPENKTMLTSVLTYHVVKGAVPAAKVVTLKRATTVNGASVTIAVRKKKVYLNGSTRVTKTDIKASNGIIHVIDKVLLPPS